MSGLILDCVSGIRGRHKRMGYFEIFRNADGWDEAFYRTLYTPTLQYNEYLAHDGDKNYTMELI